MPENIFRFKQFSINQENCAMRINTDSIILGAWTNFNEAKKILDIGTGTGILALMAAQNNNTALIEAIEIEENAYHQAKQNVKNSLWKNRISVIHNDINIFSTRCKCQYDLIITNPPYFTNALTNHKKEKTIARHTTKLNYQDIIKTTNKLLDTNGTLNIILPAENAEEFIYLSVLSKLYVIRKLHIRSFSNQNPIRICLSLSHQSNNQTLTEIITIYNQDKSYTKEYIALTEAFYLF
jgi:tRNA1Val (adenine37-N6)-methyltransferase